MAMEDMAARLTLTSTKDPAFCEGCVYGKHHLTSFPVNTVRVRAEEIGVLVHTNIVSPFSTNSLGVFRYFIIFKDNCSTYQILYTIAKKL